MSWKPNGYNSASPYLISHEPEKLIQFIKSTFDAIELRRINHPDGALMHLELRIDDTVIMIGGGKSKIGEFKSLIHVYVPNVDQSYAKAIKLGAKEINPPDQKPKDSDRRGTFEDPCGNVWSVATQI